MSKPDSAYIKLDNIYVDGIDTIARAKSFRNFFKFGKKEQLFPVVEILKGLSFEAKPGEVIGVLGKNGSGKSSMLKVIADIYPIKSGVRKVKGTVLPLIEKQLGFNPELSGRQNIKLALYYANRAHEYSEKFVENVIEFSELGTKIEIPLKDYSPGMVTRLSFAIAIFQNSEILILDEVFAAGDKRFRDKAADLIRNKIGNTQITLLVNHSRIDDLCDRGVIISDGKLVADGSIQDTLKQYEKEFGGDE